MTVLEEVGNVQWTSRPNGSIVEKHSIAKRRTEQIGNC